MSGETQYVHVRMRPEDLISALRETGMPMALICDPLDNGRFVLIINFREQGMASIPMDRNDVEAVIEVFKKALET